LQSTPNSTFVVDFFTNTSCDVSGNGEGETWWGSTNLATDANGNAPISLMVPVALAPGTRLTATALDVTADAQNTSEFSNCIGVALGTAAALGLEGFSGSETVETYSPNFGRQNSPVTFNGITYTDRTAGGQLWSDVPWVNNGYWRPWPNASGTTGLNDTVGRTHLQIDFSTPVNRVGILAAPGPTTYTMTAYDDNLVAMGATTVTLTEASSAAFLGLQATTNIRRIVITEAAENGTVGIFDDLRFEFVSEEAPEPEPAGIPLGTSAVMPLAFVMSVVVAGLRRRRDDRSAG
jgi:hypothetical protein